MTELSAYRPYWYVVAHADEITDQPKQVILLGERLVIFRGSDGVHALKDLCIHRGAELSGGKVVNGNIECPYHGWQYNGQGRCVLIPSIPASQPIPSKAKTECYRVAEHLGMIWVALEEPRLPLPMPPKDWQWSPADPKLRVMKRDNLHWKTSAGRWAENAFDVSHFAFVHGGLLSSTSDTLIAEHTVRETESTIDYEYDQVQPGDPGSYGKGYVHLHYQYIAPFTLFLHRRTPDGTYSLFFVNGSPVGPKDVKLYSVMIRDYDIEPEKDHIFLAFLRTAMDQDQSVVETVHPEEIPVDLREELHIKVPDAAGVALRRLFARIENGYDFGKKARDTVAAE